jgi:hypothetical protein
VAVGISSPVNIDVGQDSTFNMTSTLSSRAKSYVIIAESDNYQSKSTDIPNVQVTLPIMINNIQVTDLEGNKFSSIPLNSSVKITSNLKHIVNSPQGFVYYVQVKQFDGQVEFIGKNDTGLFFGSEAQNVSVIWTPHSAGSYYIETYVWNSDTIPLSSAGTRINVVLVK